MKSMKRAIELIVISSRWVMAPFYVGLALSLLILLYKFTLSLVELVRHLPDSNDSDVIVGVLGLVDVALIGGLVVTVIFSGYESFVSKLEGDGQPVWPAWMTKVDFSGVERKLLGSIVAISAIQVLETFMNLEKQPNVARLAWLLGIFGAFVAATVALAIANRVGENDHAD
jgi:uncharacterized protein (TIGR00645 family)